MALNLGELFGTIGLDASGWDRELNKAQGSLKSFGVAGAAIAATAAVAIGAALTKGIVDSLDVEAGTDKLQASLGLTEAQAGVAGKAAGSLFANNYGASMEDVNTSVAAVMSSIKGMRDASDADVSAMTAKMMNLSTVMGVDVGRAAQVAGQMITSGIATDGAHAADLLTASLQKVPAAVREDILDAVDEYGPFMNNLGIKGEEAMGLLVQASEKGMYGIDKTGDALKEFGIRATDMSKATSGAYDALGMNQEDMTAKLLAGGDTAKTAFGDIIHGLQTMEDPVAQSQAALALFGTPLEDLSVTEIPNFLGALDPMGDKFDSVAGAADKMGQDLTSNAAAGFGGFKRQAEAALITFVQGSIMPSVSQFASFLNTTVGPAITQLGAWITTDALPALQGFGQWFTDNQGTITNWATGIGFILIPLFVRIAISAGVSAAAQVVAWATAGAGAITAGAVYVAQSYIMIGRFVAMSAAAIAHGVVVAAVWTGQVVASAVSGAASFVVSATRVVGGWVLMGAQSLIQAARMAAAWFIALGPVGWVIAAVIGLVALIIANWSSVSRFTSEAWSNVTRFVSDAWRNITRGVSDGIGNVVSFVSGLPGRILGALGNLGSLLLGAGGQIIEGFLSGLRSGFEEVKNFVGGIGEWIAANKGPKAYDLALLVPAGGWIMTGLETGLKKSIPSLQKTLGSVSATIQSGVTGVTVGLTGAAAVPSATGAGTLGSGGGNVSVYIGDEAIDPRLVRVVRGELEHVSRQVGGMRR